ncbi:ABC-three component system middle component 1 [Listeria monocytogenes]|uniref:ABC-three component system middle component 1 n=1 Tax=Listeria monocytogenes TaxID=1639 RepID=UPI0005447D27|nr:ABC-three component system middle component 1 [Listeria monocytogenes]EAC5142049.1 hypothetical protein [Listeria monocytogenes]EAC7686788.1 hypothetical protein [Listeria monocytogenes]EAC7907024.1 hypothetical protein [Listeria monocytogenes]EAC8076373.1 hypothetical protein [Listeria monocytogenes]EAC9017141.1 hypothetical protein [Listeria monocytogenes]
MSNNIELKRIKSIINMLPLLEGEWQIVNEMYSDECLLYKLNDGRNYFFYSFPDIFSEDMALFSEKIIAHAESVIQNVLPDYIPQDTYVIFFSKIKKHEKKHTKFTIRIEENEFLFKKYVCLYTEDEISATEQKLPQLSLKEEFWGNESLRKLNSKLHSKFLLTLSIKAPIIKLKFAEIFFKSIDDRVKEVISIKQNKEYLEYLNQELEVSVNKKSPEEIAESLFLEIVGEEHEL